jgi:hypothetical protein
MPKRYYRIILILLTVLCGIGAVVTMPFAMFAAMAFDAPGSERLIFAWVVFFIVLSIPLWVVIGAVGGWFRYLHDWLRTSLVWLLRRSAPPPSDGSFSKRRETAAQERLATRM